MTYMTVQQAAEAWGVTVRQVQAYCTKGRIPGAQKFGMAWQIPATGHSYESGKCTVCGAGLTFISDANFAGFQGVMVDGTAISAEHYTARAGSTVVTLKVAYLETLSTGTHTVAILSNTGTAGARFTIHAGVSVPQTGDNSRLYLCLGVLVMSAAALAGSSLIARKRKQ